MKIDPFLRDGFLAWTLTSNGYKYLTWNFALQWSKAVPGQPLCVVCADKPSYQFLRREGIQCVLWDNALADFGPQIVPFGSRQFSTLNRLKLVLLDGFAKNEAIKQCLYLDGDIALYKNIVMDMRQRLAEKPIWMPCDERCTECTRSATNPCPNFCTGLIAWNHGADKDIFHLTDGTKWAEAPEDQLWVNRVVKEKGVQISILPRDLYPNGSRLTLTKITPELKDMAICLHYNYRVGDAKKADMKRFGDWLLPY
jgi:hypothetical protein